MAEYATMIRKSGPRPAQAIACRRLAVAVRLTLDNDDASNA
jgi:hypothetical protein